MRMQSRNVENSTQGGPSTETFSTPCIGASFRLQFLLCVRQGTLGTLSQGFSKVQTHSFGEFEKTKKIEITPRNQLHGL